MTNPYFFSGLLSWSLLFSFLLEINEENNLIELFSDLMFSSLFIPD